MNLQEIKERMNRDSHEPCTQKGCFAHRSHPCEVCRRQNIKGAMLDPDKLFLIAEIERLEEIETDLNNTIGFMQRGIDDWKAKAERLTEEAEDHKQCKSIISDLMDEVQRLRGDHIPDATKKVTNFKPVCVWTEWDEGEFWKTSCDKYFTFYDGGPKHNEMGFCCYCGLELKESE